MIITIGVLVTVSRQDHLVLYYSKLKECGLQPLMGRYKLVMKKKKPLSFRCLH